MNKIKDQRVRARVRARVQEIGKRVVLDKVLDITVEERETVCAEQLLLLFVSEKVC